MPGNQSARTAFECAGPELQLFRLSGFLLRGSIPRLLKLCSQTLNANCQLAS
jgi:hypothetical protein